ncbi:hypothetical protein [Shewanella phaeophyticola]|uniref:MetA-pathway of phenol degradation n=1 Tax=Shewanella phaeophyticola TaxID=2978345 RepID=A0ABT2P398_9GAMM|nr:hypothetical protein [Shewanella sp. KJ10-1]MCT8986947.1 hypothetical protein [Shewanella sp. KJ10-1]
MAMKPERHLWHFDLSPLSQSTFAFPALNRLVLSICAIIGLNSMSHHAVADELISSEPDASHYAFANYLGSGIYRTSGQSAAVVNVPLGFDLDESDEHRLKLRLTASFGFFDYSFNDLPGGSFPKSVGTITITPGIEYHWLVDEQLTIESYVDLGYGHNFSTHSHVGIFSTGLSTQYCFNSPEYSPVWVNRIYYAGYKSNQNDSTEGYSVFKTGVDFGVNYDWTWDDTRVEPRLFVAGHWYFDQLKFVTPVGDDVLTSYTYEVGTTLAFSKPLTLAAIGLDSVEFDRLGLSYQVGGGLKVWRLIFEFPL